MQKQLLAVVFSAALGLCAVAAAPAAQAQSCPVMTDPCLETTLTNLGYTPKKLSKGYLIVITHDTWTFNIQLVVSADGRKLGMNANLGVLNDGMTAENYRAFLVANGDIDPSTFYVDADSSKLYLHRSIDNRGLTPAILREELEHYTTGLESTSATWSKVTH